MEQVDEILESVESFVILDSLDEEEADSDESGYVEAPPKTLHNNQQDNKNTICKIIDTNDTINNELSDKITTEDDKKLIVNDDNINNLTKFKDREKVDFIKCPISETIKKLANASLRNSKSLEISPSSCLKAFNTFKNSKSFDGTRTNVDYDDQSPSLHQRKQLLAQHGVTV